MRECDAEGVAFVLVEDEKVLAVGDVLCDGAVDGRLDADLFDPVAVDGVVLLDCGLPLAGRVPLNVARSEHSADCSDDGDDLAAEAAWHFDGDAGDVYALHHNGDYV